MFSQSKKPNFFVLAVFSRSTLLISVLDVEEIYTHRYCIKSFSKYAVWAELFLHALYMQES